MGTLGRVDRVITLGRVGRGGRGGRVGRVLKLGLMRALAAAWFVALGIRREPAMCDELV